MNLTSSRRASTEEREAMKDMGFGAFLVGALTLTAVEFAGFLFVDDADIRSGKATIGATVNKGTMTGGMVVGDGIGGAFMDGDATVFLAVDRELVRRRRRGRARAEDTTEVAGGCSVGIACHKVVAGDRWFRGHRGDTGWNRHRGGRNGLVGRNDVQVIGSTDVVELEVTRCASRRRLANAEDSGFRRGR